MKELNLVIGEKYTILKPDELIADRWHGTLKGYHFDKWAQYENCLYLYIQRPRAKRVDEIIISIEKCFIFKGNFKESYRKEVIKETEKIEHSLLHRWTYEDLKNNKDLVYFHDFKEEFNVNNDLESFVDLTGEYIMNNNIKPIEAPESDEYISYIKSLLTRYNVNNLKKYIDNLGYRLLQQSFNKAIQ